MLGWKAFGALLIVSGVTLGWVKYSLISAEKTIAVQQTEIVQYKNNTAKLEQAVSTEKETIQTILSINEKSGERLYELSNKHQQVFAKNAKLNEEINNLRQTEAQVAIEKPYARGLAAGSRINTLMQSISGKATSPSNIDLHNTSVTQD
tara:strand:- start:78 stop:524 length:447 start_codon:yes stop_codon:yes gene_type:complete